MDTSQRVIIIPENEFDLLLKRVEKLEFFAKAVEETPKKDKIYTVREAAAYLRIGEEQVRVARREGRLYGIRISDKQWGFRTSELDRYLNRYKRTCLTNSNIS